MTWSPIHRWRALRLALVALVVATGLAAASHGGTPALADAATITFDDLSVNTYVSVQYQESGVTFAAPSSPPRQAGSHFYTTPGRDLAQIINRTIRSETAGGPVYSPVIAHSGSQVLAAPSCACSEFYGAGPLILTFSQPQHDVSLYTGFLATIEADGPARRIMIQSYDARDDLLSTTWTELLAPDNHITHELTTHDDAGRITKVVVDQTGPTDATHDFDFAIDDLRYDNAPAMPTADSFVPSLVITHPGDGTVLDTTIAQVEAEIHTAHFGPGYHIEENVVWPDGSLHHAIDPGRIDGHLPFLHLTRVGAGLYEGRYRNTITLNLIGPDGRLLAGDSIHVGAVIPPPRTDIAPRALEITQAINPALVAPDPYAARKTLRYYGEPLVAGKRTVVRLYATTRSSRIVVPNVEAVLYGYDPRGRDLPDSPLAAQDGPRGGINARVTIDGRDTLLQQRLDPAKSWNFVLPYSWTTAGTIRLRGALDPNGEIPQFADAEHNDDLTVTNLTFFRTSALRIQPYYFVGLVNPPNMAPATSDYSGTVDPAFTNGWLNSVMPVSDLSTVVTVPASPSFTACATGCNPGDLYRSLLETAESFWARDSRSDATLTFHPPTSPYVFYEAQLALQPGAATARTPHCAGGPTVFCSGGKAPVGAHAFTADTRDSFDTSHEMLHNLGLDHSGNAHGAGGEYWPFCHGGIALDCAGPSDSTFISRNVTDDRPMAFDTTPPGGDGSHWITARDALGAAVIKDPVAHAPYSGLEPAYPCRPSTLPPPTGTDAQMHYHDIMSYGNTNGDCVDLGEWNSTINYCRVFFTLSGLAAPDGSPTADFCKIGRGLLSADQLATLAGSAGLAPRAHAALYEPAGLSRRDIRSPSKGPGPVVVLSGEISPAGTLTLLPFFVAPHPGSQPAPQRGDYRIELLGKTGAILVTRPIAAQETSDHMQPGWRSFTTELPLRSDAVKLVLLAQRKGQQAVLTTLTRPHGVPHVTILTPGSGSVLSQTRPFTLRWQGAGPGGGPRAYDVALSVDGGRTYRTLAAGLRASSLTFNPANLPGGSLIFRVSTCDGFDTASAAVYKLWLRPRPPVVTIFAPRDGVTVPPAILVTLGGQAQDPQAGLLVGRALRWTSDRDGYLGSGVVVDTSHLSIGTHHITLTATAPDGLASAAVVTLYVRRQSFKRPPASKATPTTKQTPTAGPKGTATPTGTTTAAAPTPTSTNATTIPSTVASATTPAATATTSPSATDTPTSTPVPLAPCTPGGAYADTFDGTRSQSWNESIPLKGPSFSLTTTQGCEELTVPGDQVYDSTTKYDDAPELLRGDVKAPWTATTRLAVTAGTGSGGFHAGIVIRFSVSDQVFFGLHQSDPSSAPTLRLERTTSGILKELSGSIPASAILRVAYDGKAYTFSFELPDDSSFTSFGPALPAGSPNSVGLFTRTLSTPRAVTADFDWFDLTSP